MINIAAIGVITSLVLAKQGYICKEDFTGVKPVCSQVCFQAFPPLVMFYHQCYVYKLFYGSHERQKLILYDLKFSVKQNNFVTVVL